MAEHTDPWAPVSSTPVIEEAPAADQVDMNRLREEYGLAQAAAELVAVKRIGNRYGTVSYRQGHRTGFWDGVRFALEHGGQL